MNNKSKKFTIILAAIFIAAICVFSFIFRISGGVSVHAAASAEVQEQPAQVSEPAAQAASETTKKEIVFESEDELKYEDKSNVRNWINGKDYDDYVYTLKLYEGTGFSGRPYMFATENYAKRLEFGKTSDSTTHMESDYYLNFYNVDGSVLFDLSLGQLNSGYRMLGIELTRTQVRIYHLGYSAQANTELWSTTITDISKVEYLQDLIIHSGFIVVDNPFAESHLQMNTPITEKLTLYKTVEVPPPVQYEEEYLLEESNVLHSPTENNRGKAKTWLASVGDYGAYIYKLSFEVNGNSKSAWHSFGATVAGQDYELSGGVEQNDTGVFAGYVSYTPRGPGAGIEDTNITELPQGVKKITIELLNSKRFDAILIRMYGELADASKVGFKTCTIDDFGTLESIVFADDLRHKSSGGDNGFDGTVTEELIVTRYQTVGSSIPLPEDPTKEGHTFVGWYYDEEFTRPYRNRPIYADTKLYAKFQINRYTVTLISDEEDAEPQYQTVDWNTVLSPETPTKRGYDFLGWFYEDGTEYAGQAIKEDTTLIARWQIKTFTVTFYVDGEIYTVKEVEYGTVFSKVVEDAATENLELLAVLEGESEKKIKNFLNTEITDNYSVRAIKTKLDPTAAQLFFGQYPWIFAVGGAAMSLVVAGISIAGYFAQKHNRVQSTGRKKR